MEHHPLLDCHPRPVAGLVPSALCCKWEEKGLLPNYPLLRPGDVTIHSNNDPLSFVSYNKPPSITIDCTFTNSQEQNLFIIIHRCSIQTTQWPLTTSRRTEIQETCIHRWKWYCHTRGRYNTRNEWRKHHTSPIYNWQPWFFRPSSRKLLLS